MVNLLDATTRWHLKNEQKRDAIRSVRKALMPSAIGGIKLSTQMVYFLTYCVTELRYEWVTITMKVARKKKLGGE